MMTSFDLKAGVKGQIQHLEKAISCFHIPNPNEFMKKRDKRIPPVMVF